jgi:hypothetical protein
MAGPEESEGIGSRGAPDGRGILVPFKINNDFIYLEDLNARLFVQPPSWQSELIGDPRSFFVDDSVRDEPRVNVTCHAFGVKSQSHRRTADGEHVRNDATLGETLSQAVKARLTIFNCGG